MVLASRRRLLATLGTTAALPATGAVASAATTTATLHVRAYPGPTPDHLPTVRGWSPVHLEATLAVYRALWRLARYAETHASVDRVRVELEPMAPLAVDPRRASQETILERFRERVHEREAVTGECCHLLLWWDPLNHDLGYGGTRWPNTHVGRVADEGSQTVANIGATEAWDSRAVTNNMAIHETLHTFLSPDVVEAVIDSRCDHNLGSAVRTEPDTLEISPIATAYAGPDRVDGGTRFHGTGCHDHDRFYHHDGHDGVDTFEYTTALSEGVLEAVARYVDRYLAR